MTSGIHQIAAAPIRAVQSDDADRLSRILEASHQVAIVPIGPRWSLEQMREECSQAGWVSLGPTGSPEAFVLFRESPNSFEISLLATEPSQRGSGRMSCLLRHMISERTDSRPIWLEVHAGNLSARGLYGKLGFKLVGERPRYYADGGAAVLYNYG